MEAYRRFSEHLMDRYGEKVYKIPVNLMVTCPNRDGTLGRGGCIFCGEEGAGFEAQSAALSVKVQIENNIANIQKKYKPKKYMVFFQNYTNTYQPLASFCHAMEEACQKDVVAIAIATRPDAVSKEQQLFLQELKMRKQVDILLEIGLQSAREETLAWLGRGHGVKAFFECVKMVHAHDLEVCAHYILDIPMDTEEDVIRGARLLGEAGVAQVKCHSLYVVKGTKLAKLYETGEFVPLGLAAFLERACLFLEHLPKEVVIQRIIGRAPAHRTDFCNFGMSWWKIHDLLITKINEEGRHQGRLWHFGVNETK